jgi:hypothetical protein
MLEIYAAWAEGAVESDVAVIEQAMGLRPEAKRPAGLLSNIKQRLARWCLLDIPWPKPSFSIWHWICHQKR